MTQWIGKTVSTFSALLTMVNPRSQDIPEVLGQIGILLDGFITGHGIRDGGPAAFHDSNVDFEALANHFQESKPKNTYLEVFKATIHAKFEPMIELNRTRAGLAKKFEELIECYNTDCGNNEGLFEESLKLSKSLSEVELHEPWTVDVHAVHPVIIDKFPIDLDDHKPL